MSVKGLWLDRVFDGPIDDYCIYPWINYLKDKSVFPHLEFKWETEVVNLLYNDPVTKVTGVEIVHGSQRHCIHGIDYLICTMPVDILSQFGEESKLFEYAKSLETVKVLDVKWMNGVFFS